MIFLSSNRAAPDGGWHFSLSLGKSPSQTSRDCSTPCLPQHPMNYFYFVSQFSTNPRAILWFPPNVARDFIALHHHSVCVCVWCHWCVSVCGRAHATVGVCPPLQIRACYTLRVFIFGPAIPSGRVQNIRRCCRTIIWVFCLCFFYLPVILRGLTEFSGVSLWSLK